MHEKFTQKLDNKIQTVLTTQFPLSICKSVHFQISQPAFSLVSELHALRVTFSEFCLWERSFQRMQRILF